MSTLKRLYTQDSILPWENERLSRPSHNASVVSVHEAVQSSLKERGGSSCVESISKSFQDLGVREPLCEACDSLGYTMPTPIQALAIPIAMQGRDLIGLAETGSGKTAAFVLPILQALMDKPQSLHSLIVAPTRELAQQICNVVEALGAVISVRCTLLIGGVEMISQAIALAKKPHVVVATPGRLVDHLENTKGFSLRQLEYLVLDEADRLLDLDFGPVLDKLLKVLPKRTTYLFSATMSSKVESLQRASLSNPMRVSASTNHQTVSTLLQSFTIIPHKDKDSHLVHILNGRVGQTAIVFTRTVNETQRIYIMLRTLGFPAIPLHGQLSQTVRLGALNKFRAGFRNILIATDVAARGLDILSVDLILNYDLPHDSKTYIHRVGRTARAGRSGVAMSLVTQYDFEMWLRIEAALGKKLDESKAAEDEVAMLGKSVSDAQRVAIQKMKELHDSRGNPGATLRYKRDGKRSRDDMDSDNG